MKFSNFSECPRLWGFLIAACCGQAHAFCGFYAGKADASLFNEASQVVIARDGNQTVLTMLNDFKGPLKNFVLVVPTPTVLKPGQVRVAEKKIFERLDAYSSPRLAEYKDKDPCMFYEQTMEEIYLRGPVDSPAHPTNNKTLGVKVEVRFTLEEYDIIGLSATQSDGLERWLLENGYKIPPGAAAAFKPYIKMGMKFFIAKVNLKEQAKTGFNYLRPLQFAFESQKFMLPMRLGMLNAPANKPQDLVVYLLTRHGRVEASNYRTVKLPSNVDLPRSIKPRFSDFYVAMFDKASRDSRYRVVFTEYFWDMAWCDPCADDPLTTKELFQAGAFWIGGDPTKNFSRLLNGAGVQVQDSVSPPNPTLNSRGQPALLTRLHLRYTPESFAEDLMFIQTSDRTNWQTRYVIHTPFPGSVSDCQAKAASNNCKAYCQDLASSNSNDKEWKTEDDQDKDKEYVMECTQRCTKHNWKAVQKAVQYYQTALPARIKAEKNTLAELTGWSMAEIDAMPGSLESSLPVSNGQSGKDGQSARLWKPRR